MVNNDLSRSRCGIVIRNDPGIPDTSSNVDVIGNRCHNNAHAEIFFLASTGHIINNDCWGSMGSGIGTYNSFDVRVTGNRCHDNERAGILFAASPAHVANNDCWNNRGSGIAVEHSWKIHVTDNRCHDNEEAGILFIASTGHVVNNDCWSSRTRSGIVIQEGSSEVQVTANCCRDNEQAGILFNASTGRIANNDCWDSRAESGILIEKGSDVRVIGNRSYNNAKDGVRFSASTGHAKDNECWGNVRDEPAILFGSDVMVAEHRCQPSLSPAQLRQHHLRLTPLGAWVERQPAGLPPETLADFLTSGGCPDCFRRYWKESGPKDPSSASDSPESVQQKRLGVYRVSRMPKSGSVRITEIPANNSDWSPAHVPRPGLNAFSALLTRFGKEWDGFLHQEPLVDRSLAAVPEATKPPASAPKWAVALVSADDEHVDEWLGNIAERQEDIRRGFRRRKTEKVDAPILPGWPTKPIRIRSFDLTKFRQSDTGSPLNLADVFEEQLLAKKTGWRRFMAGVDACFLSSPKAAIAPFLLLFLLPLLYLGHRAGVEVSTLNLDPGSWRTAVQTTGNHLLGNWPSIRLLAVYWIIVTGMLWNVHVPKTLRIPLDRPLTIVTKWMEPILELLGIKRLVETLHKLAQLSWLYRLFGSTDSRMRWLVRQICGYPQLGIRTPAILVLRSVDVLEKQDAELLRRFLDRTPRGQPVLVVTQMSGLSMLTGGFLDVWFPLASSVSDGKAETTPSVCIVHDEQRARISVVPQAVPEDDAEKEERKEKIRRNLGIMLGWSKQPSETLKNWAAGLLDDQWTLNELLLGLIIGSTPYTYMSISRKWAHFTQYSADLQQQLKPYLDFFKSMQTNTVRFSEKDVDEIEASAKEGMGLLFMERPAEGMGRSHWVGRVGYRTNLADAVCEWYALHGKSSEAEQYLAELIRCGELYNLQTFADNFSKAATDRDAQLLALNLESVFFLMEDRRNLAPEIDSSLVSESDPMQLVTRCIVEHESLEVLDASADRICSVMLSIMDRLDDNRLHIEFESAIDMPWTSEAAAATEKSLWLFFMKNVRSFLRMLANRDVATAEEMLSAKLEQDWFYLPDSLKTMLRDRAPTLRQHYLNRIGEATTADDLLRRASVFQEQPALLTAWLSTLATSDVRRTDSDSTQQLVHIAKIADAVVQLREAAGASLVPPALRLQHDAPKELTAAARTLLLDEKRLKSLCEAFSRGAENRKQLAEGAQSAATEVLRGVALGVHGSLYGVLKMAEQADEQYLYAPQ